jgi:hypothetical protein
MQENTWAQLRAQRFCTGTQAQFCTTTHLCKMCWLEMQGLGLSTQPDCVSATHGNNNRCQNKRADCMNEALSAKCGLSLGADKGSHPKLSPVGASWGATNRATC